MLWRIGWREQPRLMRVVVAGLIGMVASQFSVVARLELKRQFLEKHLNAGGGLVNLVVREDLVKIGNHCSSVMACWMSSSGR